MEYFWTMVLLLLRICVLLSSLAFPASELQALFKGPLKWFHVIPDETGQWRGQSDFTGRADGQDCSKKILMTALVLIHLLIQMTSSVKMSCFSGCWCARVTGSLNRLDTWHRHKTRQAWWVKSSLVFIIALLQRWQSEKNVYFGRMHF